MILAYQKAIQIFSARNKSNLSGGNRRVYVDPAKAVGKIELFSEKFVSGWIASAKDPLFIEIAVNDNACFSHALFSEVAASDSQPKRLRFVASFETDLEDGDRIEVRTPCGKQLSGSPFAYGTLKIPPSKTNEEIRIHIETPEKVIRRRLVKFSGWATLHTTECDLRFAIDDVPQNTTFLNRPDVAVHFDTPFSVGWEFTCDVSSAIGRKSVDFTCILNGETVLAQTIEMSFPDNDDALVLFMHIPKTAGMSLVHAIRKQPKIEAHWLYGTGQWPIERQMESFSPNAFNELNLVGGHFTFGLHQQISRRCRYIAFLREPLSYLKSYFFYRKYVQRYLPFQEIDIYEALERRLDHLLDNGLTRFFAPMSDEAVEDCDLQRAITNMESSFVFVGSVERMEESVARVSNILGADLELLTDNLTPPSAEAASLDPEEFAYRAAPFVSFDRTLYQHAQIKFWS